MQKTLVTGRLSLAPLTEQDLSWFAPLNRTEPVRRHVWDGELLSDAQCRDFLIESQRLFREKGYGLWKAQQGADIVGYYGLWFFGHLQPQLLYVTSPEAAQKGYAREACRAVMDYAFTELGFTYLDAALDDADHGSRQVAEALGFSHLRTTVEDGMETQFYRATA